MNRATRSKPAPQTPAPPCVRCWWDCTNHGILKKPIVELVGLTLNGDPLEARTVEKKSPNGDRTDYYHLCRLPSTSGRAMTVTATLRHIATGQQATKEFQFTSSPSA